LSFSRRALFRKGLDAFLDLGAARSVVPQSRDQVRWTLDQPIRREHDVPPCEP
jgi:hypothetical protein